MLDVRVCEEFGILPYLQVTKLACYYSMDAGRTQEIPMSDRILLLAAREQHEHKFT